MNRFEIEDIITQDGNGIIFRARDNENGHTVALRRFLPFGQDGGGLDKDEAAAFASAAQLLSAITHDALRSIVMGAADPIDGIPFIAAEWIEGAPLDHVMGGTNLDPDLVIDVLRIALEVSVVLSHVLGEEAVWVETSVESIHVGSRESGRGFIFWISPFKWLGAEFGSRKLSSVVELGEELTGWKDKLVDDQAGHGLGGWMKWIRNNPDSGLLEALEKLASSTGKEPPPNEPDLVAQATARPVAVVKKSPSSGAIMIAATLALLIAGGALIYLKPFKDVSLQTAKLEISSPAAEPPKLAAKSPAAELTPESYVETPRGAARQGEREIIQLNASARERPDQTEARSLPAKATPRILSPEDGVLISTLPEGTVVRLQGVIMAINHAGDDKPLYFEFSKTRRKEQIRAVALPSAYSGKLTTKAFGKLIGKRVVIEGEVMHVPETWNKLPMVTVTSQKQVQAAK
jgi:hypothetical protein